MFLFGRRRDWFNEESDEINVDDHFSKLGWLFV